MVWHFQNEVLFFELPKLPLLVRIQQGYPKERKKENQVCPQWIQRYSNRVKGINTRVFSSVKTILVLFNKLELNHFRKVMKETGKEFYWLKSFEF